MLYALISYNVFILFFLFVCNRYVFAQSLESFCKNEKAIIIKLNKVTYCMTDLSNSTQRSGFINSVPFNQKWKDNTLKVLFEAFKQYTFLNKVQDAGIDFKYN